MKLVVAFCIFILSCQCAFWGLNEEYTAVISIDAETGATQVVKRLPIATAFIGGEQCVADPEGKILYFIGSTLDPRPQVIGVDLTTGNIISATVLPNYYCCFIVIVFVAPNQILVVGPDQNQDKYLVSMVYTDTNQVVLLTTWYNRKMAFGGSAPGVFDSQNNVAWVQLPYFEPTTSYTMNMGFNILTNQTLHLNDTLNNWYLGYSQQGGYIVGLSAFNVTWQYPPGEQVGSFGLSKFTSTDLVEELYAFPIQGWNVMGSNIAIDPTIGTDGTIFAAISQSYRGYYWASIDIASGSILNTTLLNKGATTLPPYGCVVYTN